ncbi:MAG TPA: peptidylprolyl isomerase [Allosphingosinicella sp.]|nr:peptidylprolyl isomerase [Allosphingosinicella sp.]
MRITTLLALLLGLFLAGSAAAQAPAPATGPSLAPPPITPENVLLLDLSSGGRVAIQLRPDIAPNHVARMKALARQGFYNGLTFHRVIEGFMAQGGDPTGDGTGGSQLPDLKAEFNGLPHVRGAIAAARSQSEDSANSQFYIMLGTRLSLDGRYTVFGRVISGMSFVDGIEKGEPPVSPSRILQASIASDNKAAPAPGQALAAPAVRSAAPASRASPGGMAGPAVPPPPSIRLPEPKPKAPPKKSR